MKKLNQNDLCFCASGEKYKDCCAKSNVIPFQPLHLDQELQKIQEQLIEFSIENYEQQIDMLIIGYIEENIMNSEQADLDTYANLLIAWLIVNEPIIGNQTVLDIFIKRKRKRLKNTKVKEALVTWQDAKSSVFEIVSIQEEAKDTINVRDIFTDKLFSVNHEQASTLTVGDYIMGTLAPFVYSHQFIFLTVLISRENKGAIDSLLALYEGETELMNDLFPEWLGNLIDPEEDELEWSDDKHRQVADMFVVHSVEKEVDGDKIHLGTMFWNIYCLKFDPYITKVAAYAAALDYFVAKVIINNDKITQAEIAREYNVSPATISSHYQKFIKELKEFEREDMEEFISEEFDIPEDVTIETIDDIIDLAKNSDLDKRAQLLEVVLKVEPNHLEALVLLAEAEQNSARKLQLLKDALDATEDILYTSVYEENGENFWTNLETRQFMFIQAKLAQLLKEVQSYEEAIYIYEQMLMLNVNDNQGIRYELVPLYIENRMFDQALNVIKQYKDTQMLFNKVLIHIMRDGNTPDTRKELSEAVKENSYVADYLTGAKEIPKEPITYYEPGGETEAVLYAEMTKHLWADALYMFDNI